MGVLITLLNGLHKLKEAWPIINQNFQNIKIETDEIIRGNANAEVGDAHISTAKGKTFNVLRDRLEETENDVISHKADKAKHGNYTPVMLPKVISDAMLCSGTGGTNIITAGSASYGLAVGDKIAIEGAGVKKNNSVFMLCVTNTPAANGNVTITINGVAYTIAVLTTDTKLAITNKIHALNIPFTYKEEKDNNILYDSGATNPVTITYNFNATGLVITSVIDNTIVYNYLRTTITNIAGTAITLQDNLLQSIVNKTIKLDHTDIVQVAFDACSATDYRIYFESNTYNIFDYMNNIEGINNFHIMGDGESSILDCINQVGVYTPFIYGNDILYYIDGQALKFTTVDGLKIENITIQSKYRLDIFLRDCSNVVIKNCRITMESATNTNNAGIGIYSTAAGADPVNYTIEDCKFKAGSTSIIFLGDVANPIHGINIKNCTFELQTPSSYGALKYGENLKLDTNTYDVEISGCVFDGGESSAVTIEEGCKNIDIHDNTFKNAVQRFIRISSGQTNLMCKNIKIHHNTFTNYITGIEVVYISSGFVVENLYIEHNTVSGKETANTSTFLNLSRCKNLHVFNNDIKNSDVSTSQIIAIDSCEDLYIENNKIPQMGNVDMGQIYITTCTNVYVNGNTVAIIYFQFATNVHVNNNDIYGRIEFKNCYDAEIRNNGLNLGDTTLVANYYPIIKMWTNAAPDNGKYNIYFNRFYSTHGAVAMSAASASIVINQSNNVLQV